MANVTIVMYHYVRDLARSRFPRIKGLSTERFRGQLDAIQASYTVVSMGDLIGAVSDGDSLPPDACLLTFDDGYSDHARIVLPELLSRGLSGSFFPPVRPVVERVLLDVNKVHFVLAATDEPSRLVAELREIYLVHDLERETGISFDQHFHTLAHADRFDPAEVIFVKRFLQHALAEAWRERIADTLFAAHVSADPKSFADDLYMAESDLAELVDDGMYVGSHGYSHVFLDKEPFSRQVMEIEHSLELLKRVGAPTGAWAMCYPFGAYNDDTLAIVTARGCAIGLTTRAARANIVTDPPLELPRLDTNDMPFAVTSADHFQRTSEDSA
ncbi:MAG: polysaccharide deacetylase family protein [Gemmatimonadota bacterium]|nr:polysaccharide deacetylase family protein [Gemmatimonadota bacterium]